MSFAINKNTINRNGRPKGTPNKDTAEIKAVFQLLLENNIEALQEDFEALQPAQRIKFLLEVASFIIPKMKSTELAIDNKRIFDPITINMNDWQ
jgi:hypothetical protein